jgi:dihydroflavonol-4-reductase
MTTLITGGTGFLGRHLTSRLLERGEHVRVFTRGFDLELADQGAEIFEGSLSESDDIARAVEGVDRVYHLAGRVERDPEFAHLMYELHVDGTRRLLRALQDSNVEKIVIASTSGTVGVSRESGFVATDDDPMVEHVVRHWPYYLSKIYAERVCDQFVANHGMPIVQMRPTLLLGPGDRRESSTGDVVRFMKQRIPTVPSGGMSFVDVRDVAEAFMLAMDDAKPGEKYLLGAENLTLEAFFKRLESITGLASPRLTIPDSAAVAGARLLDGAMRLFGKRADLDPVSVDMAQYYWYIDWSKATRDLGWQPRDPDDTLRDTVRWIEREHPDFRGSTDNGASRREPPPGFVPAETLEYAEELRRQERR